MANFLMPENTFESEVNHEATVAVARGPIGDIAATDDGTVVVTNYADDTVSLLDADTREVVGVVAVPGEPFAVAVSDDRAFVSTSSASSDAVSVIDTVTQTVIATYSLAFNVAALAASPDGKRVYAARIGDNYADVAVIDVTAERVGTMDIGTGAGIGIDAMCVDSTGKRLYVATTYAGGSSVVTVDIETARIERTVPVGSPIRDLAVADAVAYVLTSDRASGGSVNVIDLSTGDVTHSIDLGVGAPTQMAISADNTRLYVVDYDGVTAVCTLSGTIVDTMKFEARPSCVAVDSEAGRLHVADYSGEVTTFAVAAAVPQLYSQFVPTDPVRVLEPAGV